MKIYGWVRKTGGVSWYRIQEKLRGLSMMGHETSFGTEMNIGKVLDCDVLLTSVHGETEASKGWELLATLPGRPFMVYDIDDNVWQFRKGLPQHKYWMDPELLRNVQSGIACADLVTTTTVPLAELVSELNPSVAVVPNYVPEFLLKMNPVNPDAFTIGYQGGDTHQYDLDQVSKYLFKFLVDTRITNMAMWGTSQYDGPFPERIILTPWERNIRRYYQSLVMSVGLAPLEDTPFNTCKSAIKAVEYAALGIPCVASRSPAYSDTVIHGRTGLLLENNKEWYYNLKWLFEDRIALKEMGQTARELAQEWTTERHAGEYENMLKGAMHG